MIDDFISDVCEELDIPIPNVSFDTSVFKTETTMAACIDNTIYIKDVKPNPDLLFAIAHELRHQWQLKYQPLHYFSSYKESGQIPVEEYNLQIAEVDANAFASIVMIDWFGLQPLYNGVPKNVVSVIKRRINEILEEEY